MTKIAIITNIPSPYRVDLFYYLQTHYDNYNFHVIYTARTEDNRCWRVSEEKIRNSVFLSSKIIKLHGKEDVRYIHLPSKVCKALKNISPDVVIAAEYNPAAIQACLWCKYKKIPFVHWTDGTLHSERNINFVQKMARKLIIANSACAIASSTKSKEKLIVWGMQPDKIFISLLTVDIGAIAREDRDVYAGRLLYVGSMVSRKGLDLLMDALQYVKVDYHLHIVGNGSDDEIRYLQEKMQKLGIQDKIKVIGFKQGEALWQEYKESQVFVMPSREDCFGLVLLEALAAGKTIVASKYADGTYDIVDDGVNGLIVDPFDSVAFARAIDDSLTNEYLNGYRPDILQKFSFAEVCKGFEKAIESVSS